VSVGTWLDWDGRFFLVLAALCAAAGYVAGWAGRTGYERGPNVFLCAGVLLVFNGSLWYFNHTALFWVRRATDRDLSPLLSWMAEADRWHCFDVMAVLITVVTAWAALMRNRRWLFASATACVLIWLIVMSIGFVSASICLIDVF